MIQINLHFELKNAATLTAMFYIINYSFTGYENIIDIYLAILVNTRSKLEFNAAAQAKFKEFKEMFIEPIKSNLKEIFKDENRKIIKEELSNLEKVSSTVNLLQNHVSSLMESNITLQKKMF